MKGRFPAAHHRAKATIKACVESGAGIDFMPGAPRFRYTPPAEKPLHHGKPSSRGSVRIACSKRNCACRDSLWYRHEPATLAPYGVLNLTDTPWEEAHAKAAWLNGDPIPLRELLAERAKERANLKVADVCEAMLEAA